jgi:hypothetical protein
MFNRDPNHYAKGLAKHMCHEYLALNVVVATLKAHFLVGMYYFPSLFVLHKRAADISTNRRTIVEEA